MARRNDSLSATFLNDAIRDKADVTPQSPVEKMTLLTERVRQEVLLPQVEKIRQGKVSVERKDTGDLRGGDAKTITVETDQIVENRLIELEQEAFPDAWIIGEEMFGSASTAEKKAMLEKVLAYDGLVILNDALDGTRPFTQDKDGFGTMVSLVKNGKLIGAVVHLTRRKEDPDNLGYTLTWEEGDVVRMNGVALPTLTEMDKKQPFAKDASMLRGYSGFEFLKGTSELSAAFAVSKPPKLREAFDSMSDLWTCGTLYRDLLLGQHHFMIIPPPIDIFDYPMGIALLEKAGGVAKFADGTPATLEEIIKRQGFGEASSLTDPKNFRAPENTLILAVSEGVFEAVCKTFDAQILSHRRNEAATHIALKGGNPAHAQGGSGIAASTKPVHDAEIAKASSVLDLFDALTFQYISSPLLYSKELAEALEQGLMPDHAAIIAANLTHTNKVADAAKAQGSALIVPARFNDTAFPFTPLQRMQFLYDVINKKATSIQMANGWEYAPACIEEYIGALMLQSGRSGAPKDIAIIDEAGNRLTVSEAVKKAGTAVEKMLTAEAPVLIASQAQNFLYLYALGWQLCRDARNGDVPDACVSRKEGWELEKTLRDLRRVLGPLKELGLHQPTSVHYYDDVAKQVQGKLSAEDGITRSEEYALLTSDQPRLIKKPKAP